MKCLLNKSNFLLSDCHFHISKIAYSSLRRKTKMRHVSSVRMVILLKGSQSPDAVMNVVTLNPNLSTICYLNLVVLLKCPLSLFFVLTYFQLRAFL